MHRKKIVIMGGGIAGMEVYKYLHKRLCRGNACGADITLISEHNYFTFVPMLHEAATGGVSVDHVVTAVREIMRCHNHAFLRRTITHIDIAKKIVETNEGPVPFDIGVIALGSRPAYFGTPGAREYTLALRTAADAQALRSKLNHLFEETAKNFLEHAGHPRHLVIVGGGPVGVEMAGQLHALIKDIGTLYRRDISRLFKVVIVHGGNRLLPASHPRLSAWAERACADRGIIVRLNTLVASVSKDAVTLKDTAQNAIPFSCALTIWAAGFSSAAAGVVDAAFLDDRGFVCTDLTLAVPKNEYVFAVGDNARLYAQGEPLGPYMLAEAAYDGAQVVGKNILRILNGRHEFVPFRYQSKGSLIPIGNGFAIAEIFGRFRFKGFFAWWLRRTVYLIYVYSWRDKIRIAMEWTLDLFGTRDTTEEV